MADMDLIIKTPDPLTRDEDSVPSYDGSFKRGAGNATFPYDTRYGSTRPSCDAGWKKEENEGD